MKQRHLIVFVKSPTAKDVKTRLARSIGDGEARRLYRCFGLDLLETLDQGDCPLSILYYPHNEGPAVKEWLGDGRTYEPQSGQDLGARMKNAFAKSFADGFTTTVLVGTDVPDLPQSWIEQAFSALENSDAVIGPARDGGYYLIGFRAETFLPDVFTGPAWGSDSVLQQTCDLLARHERRFFLLPPRRDIDTYEDLQALMKEHGHTTFGKSRTIRYARSRNWPVL